MSAEYRHMRSGSLNIPSGGSQAAAAAPRLDGPRSPPNTSHVPCKFFRQGACQAGKACPFSHDLGAAAENICKYFAKGNCKFGPKCANLHILPDGRRVNYGKNGVTIGNTPVNLTGRSSHPAPSSSAAHTTSALTTSLFGAEQPVFPYGFEADRQQSIGLQKNDDNGASNMDTPYSAYGSPRDDVSSRFGFGLSPKAQGLSVLDAPLPPSFDPNGISNAARFPAAPWPSSVPSKFGLESPLPSLSNAQDSSATDTLKLLHNSAFGSSDHLITPTATSPPMSGSDEYFSRRSMHSARYSKPRMLSASLPKAMSVDQDWEAEFAFGDDNGDNLPENYVPENLQDLLTPAEKARRGSMRADDDSSSGMSKYGSPIGTSPSRFNSFFQRQKEEEETARLGRSAGSAFGHVGSPLRNSVLAQGTDAFGRPSVLRSGSESMSMLSQQFQRSRLDDPVSTPTTHVTRVTSAGIIPSTKDRVMERHVSSGSISSSMTGRFTTPIDEEDGAFVFSMEEDDSVARMRKRGSAGIGMGSLSSYPGIASSKSHSHGSEDGREPVSVTGR